MRTTGTTESNLQKYPLAVLANLFNLPDPLTVHSYTYVNNNPVKYVDPTGNTFELWNCDNIVDSAVETPAGRMSQADCWAHNALANGSYEAPDVDNLIEELIELLEQSPTGKLLIEALKSGKNGKSVDWGVEFVENLVDANGRSLGATIVPGRGRDGKNLRWTVQINALDFLTGLDIIASGGSESPIHENSENYLMYIAASKIGHELFHIAVGDLSGAASLGDDTGTAYRVEGKILYELLKQDNKSLNLRDFAHKWNYTDKLITKSNSAAYSGLKENRFRVETTAIKALLNVNLKHGR